MVKRKKHSPHGLRAVMHIASEAKLPISLQSVINHNISNCFYVLICTTVAVELCFPALKCDRCMEEANCSLLALSVNAWWV